MSKLNNNNLLCFMIIVIFITIILISYLRDRCKNCFKAGGQVKKNQKEMNVKELKHEKLIKKAFNLYPSIITEELKDILIEKSKKNEYGKFINKKIKLKKQKNRIKKEYQKSIISKSDDKVKLTEKFTVGAFCTDDDCDILSGTSGQLNDICNAEMFGGSLPNNPGSVASCYDSDNICRSMSHSEFIEFLRLGTNCFQTGCINNYYRSPYNNKDIDPTSFNTTTNAHTCRNIDYGSPYRLNSNYIGPGTATYNNIIENYPPLSLSDFCALLHDIMYGLISTQEDAYNADAALVANLIHNQDVNGTPMVNNYLALPFAIASIKSHLIHDDHVVMDPNNTVWKSSRYIENRNDVLSAYQKVLNQFLDDEHNVIVEFGFLERYIDPDTMTFNLSKERDSTYIDPSYLDIIGNCPDGTFLDQNVCVTQRQHGKECQEDQQCIHNDCDFENWMICSNNHCGGMWPFPCCASNGNLRQKMCLGPLTERLDDP